MAPERKLPPLRANRMRDTWCAGVLPDSVGQQVRVAGWVHRRRDHGGLVFVDLRDRTGLVQLVFDPERGDAHDVAHELRAEHVVSVSGEVVRRDPETVNPELVTGEVEVAAEGIDVLAESQTPPFEIEGFSGEVGEEARLRHRYLDLRRERMRQGIELRARVASSMREFLEREGFVEIETPILTRSTPEGARDFLVPSRLRQGSFYALPQSPQLFKQMLMVAGFERYYQIARCFRDEDQRADRQLDFTQLDIEMSFVGVEDVLEVNERLIAHVLGAAGVEVDLPLPRIPWDVAIARYGTDRPDTRFGMELRELTEHLGETGFKAFRETIESGGAVRGMNAGPRELSRGQLDQLIEEAQELGARGLVWAYREPGGWRAPVAKFIEPEAIEAMSESLEASEGDLLLLVADEPVRAAQVLGALRTRLGERWGLVPEGEHALAWVVDWPLFLPGERQGAWVSPHHPFTAPEGGLDPSDPGSARAQAYDLVWNGIELGGGSIRINRPEVQREVFEVLGIGAEEADARFGFLLEALRYGAPPHGGIAYGLDRLVAELHGSETIRDVIAFPKTATGGDPLTGAPAPVDARQLRELGIRSAG